MTNEDKVRHCLDLLQEAQGLIDEAARSLCSVPGYADEWSGLDEPYNIIKAHWHNVEGRRLLLRQREMAAEAGRKELPT